MASINPNKDDMRTREVTLSDIVEMCQDCVRECRRRTQRVVTNRARAPRGWEKEWEERAKQNQGEEFAKCMDACEPVARTCPPPNVTRLYRNEFKEDGAEQKPEGSRGPWWKFGLGAKSGEPASGSLPSFENNGVVTDAGVRAASANTPERTSHITVTEADMTRCENTVVTFTNVLYMLAHKPTKVMFDSYDPKTGDKYDPETGEWLTRESKNRVSGVEIDRMIAERWYGGAGSKLRAGVAAATAASLTGSSGASADEVAELQALAAELQDDSAPTTTRERMERMSQTGQLHAIPKPPSPPQPDGTHGTVPKW